MLFRLKTGEGDSRAFNTRDACVCANGDLLLSGYDSDPDLENFIGSSDWEGELLVKEEHVARVHIALEREFGRPKSTNPDKALLELIARGFGGKLNCMTRFAEWLTARRIPHSEHAE